MASEESLGDVHTTGISGVHAEPWKTQDHGEHQEVVRKGRSGWSLWGLYRVLWVVVLGRQSLLDIF